MSPLSVDSMSFAQVPAVVAAPAGNADLVSVRSAALSRNALRRFLVIAALMATVAGCAGSEPRSATVSAQGSPATIDDRYGTNEEAVPDDAAAAGAVAGSAVLTPAEVPEAAAVDYAQAIAAMDTRNWLEAEAALESFVLEYPAFPGPYVNLAIVYRHDGRDDDAETALTRALELDPGNPAANNQLGILLRERGKFDEAEAAYRRALSGDSDYWLAHYNLAVLLDLYLRRESEALEHYEIYQALAPEPEDEVGFWIVDLRRRLGLPADARLARGDGP